MSSQTLDDIPNVSIDPTGRFKYIQIRLRLDSKEKYVVRGYKRAEYHADILDEFEKRIENKEIKVECVGGGRIFHEPEKKDIFVFGYSQAFGRPDHQISVDLLKQAYPDYLQITFSNEGY